MEKLVQFLVFALIFRLSRCQLPDNILSQKPQFPQLPQLPQLSELPPDLLPLIAQSPELFSLFPGLQSTQWFLDYIENEGKEYLNGISESQCKTDLRKVYNSLLNRETWALQMADAWAKPQTGLLSGNLMHLGNFDECLAVSHKDEDTEILGQYCTSVFVPTNPEIVRMLINIMLGEDYNQTKPYGELVYFIQGLKLSYGICIPSTCTAEHMKDIYNYTRHYFQLEFYMFSPDEFCSYNGKKPWTNSTIFGITIFSICIITVLITTIYDMLTSQHKERNQVLIAFSALTNGRRILSKSGADNQMCCLNGLRVISMVWVIVAHRFMCYYYTPHVNGEAVKRWKLDVENMIFLSAPFAVDTFFAIGGLLVSYLFFQTKADGRKISVPMYYAHRILRLTPSLAAVILLFATVLEHVGDGPLWPIVHNLYVRDCQENWWITLLYIQNYLHPQNQCASQAWYLAVDTQLYFLAPLLLFPLAKWPKRTMSVIVILTLTSLAYVFGCTWTLNIGSVYFDETTDFHNYYIGTHTRASSWFIGFIMGYILFKIKNKKVSMKRSLVISLWLISLATTSAVVFGHITFTRNRYNVVRSAMFNTFSRPAWCLAICWIIFACTKGYGGVVNKILSLPIFNIMIRINYNMYLIHMLTIMYFLLREKTSTHFENIEQLHVVCADVFCTALLAFIWTLLFESPVLALEKIIFKKDDSKRHKPIQDSNSLHEVQSQPQKLHL